MKRLLLRTLLCLVPMLCFPSHASAQVFRAYVASYGNDSNPCSVSLPCRLLPAAIAVVADSGEIWMLDSANFNLGTVDVSTKSLTIMAIPGQVGSIVSVNNAPAITLNGRALTLRNVSIVTNATNPGSLGVDVSNGGYLEVIDSYFSVWNNTQSGLAVNATGQAHVGIRHSRFVWTNRGIAVSGETRLAVSDSVFENIYDFAIQVNAGSSLAVGGAEVSRCEFREAGTGVSVSATSAGTSGRAYVFDSVFLSNGVAVSSVATVTGSVASLTLGSSRILGSLKNAYYQSGAQGTLYTMGNNIMQDNLSQTSPGTLTAAGFQ